MRVAIFTETYHPFISGVVTHIETLKKGLEACGHKVLIVTLDPKSSRHYVRDGVLYCPAIPLKRIYGYGLANPLNLERLRYVKLFGPDIIHIHTEFSMGIFGMFAARRLGLPTVYTLHTMYDDYMFYLAPHRPFQKLMKPGAHLYFRYVASRATEVIGPSPKVVEYLRRCGVRRHINIIPNTVDLRDFLPENVPEDQVEQARRRLGICPGDTTLLFVGRLGKEKSLDVLIQDFAGQFRGKAGYRLILIGDGPERENLGQLVHSLGVQEQVRLLGKIDHSLLPPYYQACDLFATASLSEMNSISMLEAMAGGLYVLQRLDVYNKDQILPGVNGDFFEDAAGFARLVQEQAALSPRQRLARRQSVSEYSRRYGPREFTHSVLSVYDRAILEHPRSR